MSNHDSQELIRELRTRFPIFDNVAGRFGEGSPEERIPWFFALLLAASMKGEPGACCFVLDKTPGTAPLTAVFLALARLQEDFPRLAGNSLTGEIPSELGDLSNLDHLYLDGNSLTGSIQPH